MTRAGLTNKEIRFRAARLAAIMVEGDPISWINLFETDLSDNDRQRVEKQIHYIADGLRRKARTMHNTL